MLLNVSSEFVNGHRVVCPSCGQEVYVFGDVCQLDVFYCDHCGYEDDEPNYPNYEEM